MIKKLIPYSLLFYTLFAIPSLVYAAGLIPCEGADCNFCHFFQLGENIIYNLLLKIGPAIATIFIIWGAIKMMLSGGSPEKMQEGKKIMTSAIIGLVIAFAAWLILDTVFGFLAKGTPDFSWNLWKKNINCP